jgi:RNA polymerase sigma-70 factor (ECF subfamily)
MPPEFDELIRQHGPRIRRIALRYASSGAVDDLVQNILVRLWRSYPSFRAEAKVETWIYRVALNAAITHVRSSIKEREGQATLAARSPGPAVVHAGSSMTDVLEGFLRMLGNIDAAILMMYLDGLTAEEMSRVLGISSNSINARISRLKLRFTAAYID